MSHAEVGIWPEAPLRQRGEPGCEGCVLLILVSRPGGKEERMDASVNALSHGEALGQHRDGLTRADTEIWHYCVERHLAA